MIFRVQLQGKTVALKRWRQRLLLQYEK